MKTVNEIKAGIAKGKKHAIVAITEHMCDVDELAHFIEKETGRETRATVLGHIQRGGSPVPYDRILASRMGAYAIDLLLAGYGGRCVGIQNEQLVHHDIIDAIENMKRPFKVTGWTARKTVLMISEKGRFLYPETDDRSKNA